MKRPALDTVACVKAACQLFRRPAAGHLVSRKVYGHAQLRLLRCRTGGEECSVRRGRAFCNIQLPEATAADSIGHLDAGGSVRATARLVQVATETVDRLLQVAGRHATRLHDPHGWASGPMEAAGSGLFEADLLGTQLDGLSRASVSTTTCARTAVVRPKSLAAVMPSTSRRAWTRSTANRVCRSTSESTFRCPWAHRKVCSLKNARKNRR